MTRKELIRQYKETRRPMGVYRVHNLVSDKSFIGSGADLPAALNSNKAQLRLGVHSVRDLQADWNALGPDSFAFEIVDEIKPPDRPDYDPADDLRALEALWLDKLAPFEDRGYNRRPKRAP